MTDKSSSVIESTSFTGSPYERVTFIFRGGFKLSVKNKRSSTLSIPNNLVFLTKVKYRCANNMIF